MEEVKMPLFLEDMIVCIENLKEYTHKKLILLEIISGFSMAARHKISIQKNKWHFNILSRNNYKVIFWISFISALKNTNFLGMNAMEIGQYHDNENYSI